jgi:hypothetical protein
MARPRQADLGGARSVEAGTEQHHRGRGLGADRAFEHPGVPATRVQTDAQEPGVESGRLARDANVAREGEVHARAHRGPVDCRDGRQRRSEHAQEAVVDRRDRAATALAALVGQCAQRGDVGTRAERGRLAGDHDRADRLVRFQRVEGLDDLGDHRGRHRVAPFPIDERHERDAIALLDPNVIHQSFRITAGECRKKSSTSR